MKEIILFLQTVTALKYGFIICFLFFIIFNVYLLLALITKNKHLHVPMFKFLNKIWIVLTINSILLLSIVGLIMGILLPQPVVIAPGSPSLEAVQITKQDPFKIVFDRPINKNFLEKSISPDIDGMWIFTSTNYLFIPDTLIFVPNVSPAAESRYTISLKNIKNIFGVKKTDYLLSFMAPPLPNIKLIEPINGAQDVLINQGIVVETDFPHEDLARLDFALVPEIELSATKETETKYILKARDGLKKSTTYSLNISRTPISRNFTDDSHKEIGEASLISQSTFRTIEAPGVADYGPKGSGILVSDSVWIEFRQDMDKASTEKAFSISPSSAGTIAWESNRKFVYKPNAPLTKNTNYTASVSRDARAIDESPFEDVFSFTFTTIGPVTVSSFYPGNNAYGILLGTKISVAFNQGVDHASAESKFSISPNVGGSFSWSGNTLTYNQAGLSYYTKYTINIAGGVRTISGLDSVQAYSSSFTTQQQSVMLNVPSYAQAHMYSCMAAAARSALAYKGSYVSEDQLLSLMGYDNTPFSGTWGDPNAIWGNPYTGIVGNVDGKSGGVTWGYGAYWGPTASAISNYRPAEIKTGWNASGIAQEIANGNPVIVWWVNGVWPAYEVYWKTSGGTPVRGVNSMHVQVVKGFTGTVANPTSFTVTDSGYGYPARTYDIGTFMAKWGWFGNSAVVVR